MFKYHYNNRLFWIRIFGFGFKIKDVRIHKLLFSERNGYSSGFKLGNYYFGLLKKEIKNESF